MVDSMKDGQRHEKWSSALKMVNGMTLDANGMTKLRCIQKGNTRIFRLCYLHSEILLKKLKRDVLRTVPQVCYNLCHEVQFNQFYEQCRAWSREKRLNCFLSNVYTAQQS